MTDREKRNRERLGSSSKNWAGYVERLHARISEGLDLFRRGESIQLMLIKEGVNKVIAIFILEVKGSKMFGYTGRSKWGFGRAFHFTIKSDDDGNLWFIHRRVRYELIGGDFRDYVDIVQ